ncbi:hypothetical protein [Pseudorhodoplanes sinuspersici]|uniref:Uncharacterized protein n=1 Tax=Pseudorhodoplanes sinuspersici TaxID=1235591 RepID=A0A1W6ZP23_9HYPH|nr:hypothetical protein [Pseudorhodoplanes sinuspersici]ARP99143.1 hypothetical protein CAK95_08625 [Pseudorhodoplanes sinuspersici]RKE69203.1 hypothetical protein DFP91_3631 [Pseudorhodoplanes sinuspersici]
MKTISAFLLSALIAAAAIAGAVVFLSKMCASDVPAGPARATPRLPIHFQNSGSEAQNSGAIVEHAVLTRDGLDALLRNAQAKAPAAAESTWLRRFICDTRITDAILAAIALFLLLVGLFHVLWMRAAIRASERTANLVNEGLISSQRAYVFLRELQVAMTKNPLNDEIQTCAIQPIWENAGTTPTRHGRAHVNWKYFERSVPPEFDFADFDEVGNRITSYDDYKPLIIGPRATALSPVITIEPAILRQVRDLQGKLLIWGWAEYDEVFEDAHRHRTEFAYLVVVSGSPASHVGFSQYRLHNGVDGDCMKQPTESARPV